MKRVSTLKISEKLWSWGKSILPLGAILLVPVAANAIKAKPGLVEYTQPDGSIVNIKIYGDERSNFRASKDGYVVMENDKGFLEYAVLDANGSPKPSGKMLGASATTFDAGVQLISAKDYVPVMKSKADKTSRGQLKATRASAGDNKYVYTSCAFPTKGEPHSIVVLVEYQDVKFSMSDPFEYYNDYLNGDNFTRDNGTGSCRQYFSDSSLGVFKPTYDLYGPVLLKYNQSYYGQNDRRGDEPHAAEMIVEAVNFLDATVDFSQYDHNGDGYVDSIYVIYAGRGEADGGSVNTVWPHSWELSDDARYFGKTTGAIKVDNVLVDAYGCSQELSGRTPTGIGVFVHEFGHVMGLPDLYNTSNYNDETTPLDWSLMDQASYNNDTRTPPLFSSFERYSLGWIEPQEIYVSGDYELEKLSLNGKAYILTTEENEDEFFLLENRQLEGWDSYLPYHGMLIWHIEFSQRNWDNNTPNNNALRQGVCLVRADNRASMNTYRGDPFPGTGLVTEFTNLTAPRLVSYDRRDLNVTAISDIKEVDETIKFSATATEDRSDRQPTGIVDSIGDVNEFWTEAGCLYTSGGIFPAFDISGRKVGMVAPSSPLRVSPGIYIVGGKKLLVR